MTHEKLCLKVPCNCNVDDYGHQFDCQMSCQCEFIKLVREEIAQDIEQYKSGNSIASWLQVEKAASIVRGEK